MVDNLSDSESYDANSLQSINEEDDSRAESNSPRVHNPKRSKTNLRYDFQPEIMIEPDSRLGSKDSKRQGNNNGVRVAKPTPQISKHYLNIDTRRMKKQKTLSAHSSKGPNKRVTKSSIKKSDTRTSKWSIHQGKGQGSPTRSKTIERKFTMSSSISSIR